MKMKGEARIAGAGSTEDVPACFSFGIVFFINAAIWRKTTMEFFNQAITVLQTLVVAIGAGLGVWGVVNLMEGYGNDNPGAKVAGHEAADVRRRCHPHRHPADPAALWSVRLINKR